MKFVFAVGILAIIAHASSVAEANGKKVCYYGSWAVYRPGDGAFPVEKIDPTLCTHLIYAFVGITPDGGIKHIDAWNDLPDSGGKNSFARFNALRNINPSLKTLIAIGGWEEGSTTFSQVMSNPTTRSNFINNAANFVLKYNFNGMDLDWEYPAQRGGNSNDKGNFALLLRDMRAKFDQFGLLLSAAVGASQGLAEISYDIPQLSMYLDFINLMTYDMHGSWESSTGQNAPLFASSVDSSAQSQQLNVAACVNYWLLKGVQASKLILGIGSYGHTFKLANSGNRGLGAPTAGPGSSGPYTQTGGSLGYNEICEKLSQGGWAVTWDNQQKVPFASNGNEWVGYDNVDSVKQKVDFARSKGLGGAMLWTLETDDFLGKCNGKKYPLLSAMNDALNANGGVSTTTATPTVSQATTTTTRPPVGSGSVCQREGYVRDPVNCQVFYYCQWAGNTYTQYKYVCGDGLAFDDVQLVCNYRHLVAC